jgi:hypothetical protein
MQQRQLGGALRFHVRCYYRPDAAAPTEAWPTDLAGNITGARCTGSTHPATTRLQLTAEGGSPRRLAPSGARRIIPSGSAAPAASRPRVRLGSARPDERVTAFGLDELAQIGAGKEGSSSFTERHRDTLCSPSRFASKRHRFPSLRSAERLRSAARVCWPCDARLGAQGGRAHADFASSSASFHFDMLSEMIRVDVRAARLSCA